MYYISNGCSNVIGEKLEHWPSLSQSNVEDIFNVGPLSPIIFWHGGNGDNGAWGGGGQQSLTTIVWKGRRRMGEIT
jgi:hypothetical protein